MWHPTFIEKNDLNCPPDGAVYFNLLRGLDIWVLAQIQSAKLHRQVGGASEGETGTVLYSSNIVAGKI